MNVGGRWLKGQNAVYGYTLAHTNINLISHFPTSIVFVWRDKSPNIVTAEELA